MDSDQGGLSSLDRQRQTAAEIARKKVLAAYSSTVENVKHLPPSSKDILLRNRQNPYLTQQQSLSNYTDNNVNPSAPESAVPTPVSETVSETIPEQPTAYTAVEPTPVIENETSTPEAPADMMKDVPINQDAVNEEWKQYHSAWQNYYKDYYSNYYAKAAQTYLATEKLKSERIASGEETRARNLRKLIPVGLVVLVILIGLFLQYNRLIFTPIMAYMSPDSGSVSTSIEALDPNITQTISPDPRLIIPKLNIDVPVAFNITTNEVNAAMEQGVAQFMIPGASALPGQIGNLAISGHSSGDIYSTNPYRYIFASLERLENNDLIYIHYNSVRYTYQVVGREVVEPSNVGALVYETDKPMLTLITCTPLGTSRYRLLISAEQINPSYSSSDIATPIEPDNEDNSTDSFMPSNEPSFFEKLWNNIFGS